MLLRASRKGSVAGPGSSYVVACCVLCSRKGSVGDLCCCLILGDGLLLIHVLVTWVDSRKGSVGDPCSGYAVA